MLQRAAQVIGLLLDRVLSRYRSGAHSCGAAAAGDGGDDENNTTSWSEEGLETLAHKRGMAPYVFVPWDRVATSVLNLPVEQMDVYIPG